MPSRMLALGALSFSLLLTPLGVSVRAQSTCAGGAASPAVIISVEGAVTLQRADGQVTTPAAGDLLCPGDQVVTGDASSADIRFGSKDSVTNVLSSSTVVIAASEDVDISLSGGLMRFISSVRGAFRVRTPRTDAGIDGTEAMLAVDGPNLDTLVLVREGIVSVSDRQGGQGFKLAAGEASYAAKNTALVRATPDNVPAKFKGYLLNPEGAADWAVYYPPILLGSDADPQVARAAQLLDAGQPDEAEAALAGYQGANQAQALALRSLAAIFRNRTEEGVTLAQQAVDTDRRVAAVHIAQSYALQAKGDVEGARMAARHGIVANPDDAYAWARLAEMELTVGNRGAAANAARKSLMLAETSLGHAVLGYSQLSSSDNAAAAESFDKAIAIDTEAPLPRLGLGLTMIASGDLEAGRREIETATSLDPQRAQMRSWLGRAYLEEGLGEKAAAQFLIAQQQDPDDPSPWLFSAEQNFAANKPIVALRDLAEAEDRAEGRASLRSREGLGEDQAVRSTAAGRIFDVLGFQEQAVQKGAEAVTADPTNPGAHRFLADVYRARPGFEIAQTSERLVAQLLSKPSKSPVQPRLSEPDLALLNTTGTARVTFHEFAPVFDGNGIYAIGSVAVGNSALIEDELSLSIKEGNFSLAIGQFHTQTTGFRQNDDVRHDVVAIEGKAQITPDFTLTAEARFRETDEGDRFLKAFADRTTIRTQTERERAQFTLGGHWKISGNNDLLFFAALTDEHATEEVTSTDALLATFLSFVEDRETQSLTLEVRDTHQFEFGSLTIGGSWIDTEIKGIIDNDPLFSFSEDIQRVSGYAYLDLAPVDWANVTLGVSIDHSERANIEPDNFGGFFPARRNITQVNPKAGIRLEPVDGLVLRAAYARTLKRELVQDRTLEPTTIAGFNQFFDDPRETDSHMFGAGADIRVLDNLWIGGEYVYRNLDIPELDLDPVTFANTLTVIREGEEHIVRGYVNATFGDNIAASAGVEFIQNESELLDRPDVVETLLVPVRVSYFDESGVFGGVEAIFYDQTSTGNAATDDQGLLDIDTNEEGVVLNASVGYRFPKSKGVASLEFNNILDSSFSLQNNLNNSARPTTRPIAEGFSVIGRFTIGF